MQIINSFGGAFFSCDFLLSSILSASNLSQFCSPVFAFVFPLPSWTSTLYFPFAVDWEMPQKARKSMGLTSYAFLLLKTSPGSVLSTPADSCFISVNQHLHFLKDNRVNLIPVTPSQPSKTLFICCFTYGYPEKQK